MSGFYFVRLIGNLLPSSQAIRVKISLGEGGSWNTVRKGDGGEGERGSKGVEGDTGLNLL